MMWVIRVIQKLLLLDCSGMMQLVDCSFFQKILSFVCSF